MKLSHFLVAGALAAGMCACNSSTVYVAPDAPVKEVSFTNVHIDDSFWAPRIETNRTVSIPSVLRKANIGVTFHLTTQTRIR